MINFRRTVCIALIIFVIAFACKHGNTILEPKGFITMLVTIFFAAMCVGFIWPELPEEKDSQDE